jgi:outer membrane receptor protein involved in Fe transport
MHKFKLLLITILLAVNANGQSPNTPVLESSVYELPDYIVTGTLWDTPIQNVPQSVTLFSETAVEDRQALYFQDLVNAVPNLTMTGGNNRARYFQLRGMGENSQFEGETPDLSVRFLIDDFDFTGIGGIASLFDLKQVEVIRGAQSSAYGVNASAGIIKLSTQEANGEGSSKTKLSIGTHNQRSFGYATGGILGDKATSKTNYRLSIFQNKTDGFIENEFLNRKDTNQSEEIFSLLKLRYNPSDQSSIQTSLVYADAKADYDQWSLYNTYLKTQSDDPGEDNQRSKGISVRMNSNNFNNFSLTSVTSLLNTDSLYSYDADWGNFYSTDENGNLTEDSNSGFEGSLSTLRDRKSISQEIRMDSIDSLSSASFLNKWTAGIHFNAISEDSTIDYFDDLEIEDGFAKVFSEYSTQSISLFGQAESIINENSKLTFGLRYEYQKVDFDSETINNGIYSWGTALDTGGKVSTSDKLLGGSITYQNKISDSYTLFLSYHKGYKGAGVNTTTFRSSWGTSPKKFDSETIDNFELGISYLNPENTYKTKFNVFYLNRSDAQLRDSDGSGGWFNYFTSNQGDAKHYGAEYHSVWNFTPNWSFENNISLLKARIDESHRDLGNAPSYKFSCLLKYNPNNAFYSSISINGSDDYYEENGHDLKREAYTIVNASIGYAKNHWDISLWAKNLFDHDFTQRVFYFDNYHPEDNYAYDSKRFYKASGDPLNYGVTINYDW